MTNHKMQKDLCAGFDVSAEAAQSITDHIYTIPDVYELTDLAESWDGITTSILSGFQDPSGRFCAYADGRA